MIEIGSGTRGRNGVSQFWLAMIIPYQLHRSNLWEPRQEAGGRRKPSLSPCSPPASIALGSTWRQAVPVCDYILFLTGTTRLAPLVVLRPAHVATTPFVFTICKHFRSWSVPLQATTSYWRGGTANWPPAMRPTDLPETSPPEDSGTQQLHCFRTSQASMSYKVRKSGANPPAWPLPRTPAPWTMWKS